MKPIYFRPDKKLAPYLTAIPEGERSTIIRIALRDWFGLTNSKQGKVSYTEDDLKIFDRKDEEDGLS